MEDFKACLPGLEMSRFFGLSVHKGESLGESQ